MKSKFLKSNTNIIEGAISTQLLLFFFPILFGTFFQQLYNTADALIVGRFVGKEALAAVGGTTGTIINLFIGFFVGLSSGFSVIIAQHYGARQEKQVSDCVHTAIAFSIITGIFLSIVGFLLSPVFLRLIKVPDDIMQPALIYLRIYFIGIIPNLIYNMGASILRAIGDSKRPLIFLIISCFINIALDILFVVILKKGVAGAAIATILCQLISSLMVIFVLIKTNEPYRLYIKKIDIHPYHLTKMIYIGTAAGLQSAMYNIANIIIQAAVNTLGTDTIAAWTAFSKIDSLFWMSIQSLGISITTFVGQNFGAGKRDRVKKGIKIALLISFIVTAIIVIFLLLTGKQIYILFTTDENVIKEGMKILNYLVPALFTYIFIEIYSGALRGIGDSWVPMIITALGVCILRITWISLSLPHNPSIETVIFAYPLSWAITSIFFIIYMHKFSKMRLWLASDT